MGGFREHSISGVITAIGCCMMLIGFEITDFSQPRASMQTPGIPDLYLQHTAKRFRCWVEVKRKGGRLRPSQVAWMQIETGSGGYAIVADSVESFVFGLKYCGFPVTTDGTP